MTIDLAKRGLQCKHPGYHEHSFHDYRSNRVDEDARETTKRMRLNLTATTTRARRSRRQRGCLGQPNYRRVRCLEGAEVWRFAQLRTPLPEGHGGQQTAGERKVTERGVMSAARSASIDHAESPRNYVRCDRPNEKEAPRCGGGTRQDAEPESHRARRVS